MCRLSSSWFSSSGLDYQGCSFNFIILSNVVLINWNGSKCQELILTPSHPSPDILLSGDEFFFNFVSYCYCAYLETIKLILLLLEKGSVKLPRKKFILKRKITASCSLPETQLGLGNANCIELHAFIFMLSMSFIIISFLDWT